MTFDFTWMIGGPQGSGIETAANIFSQVSAKLGYQVFGKREYYSNIKGMHSYFAVRISDQNIQSNVMGIDMLVAFDAETLLRHAEDVVKNGTIIYDPIILDTKLDQIPFLEHGEKSRMLEFLASNGKEPKVGSFLELAKANGVNDYSISFRDVLSEIANEQNNPKLAGMKKMFNVMGVSFSLGIMKAPIQPLLEAIESVFSKKPSIIDLNKNTANYSYNFSSAKFMNFDHTINQIDKNQETIIVQGHQGSALGKIVCGCRFQSYYPITPASDESEFLESNEILEIKEDRPGSTTVVQTEDEIAAMGMAIGASLTGSRSSTSTSGPGFSLMAEMLCWT